MKVPTCMLLATLVLAGCEGEPTTDTPTPDEMFEYESTPVGDPSAETFRDDARSGPNVEVHVDPPPANNR